MAKRQPGAIERKLLLERDALLAEVTDLTARNDTLTAQLTELDVGEQSLLSFGLPDEEARVVEYVEATLLRPVTTNEAYRLGQMVQGFGPKRVLVALRKKERSNQLVRAAYAMLSNGAMGKPAPRKESTPPVQYWEPEGDPYD